MKKIVQKINYFIIIMSFFDFNAHAMIEVGLAAHEMTDYWQKKTEVFKPEQLLHTESISYTVKKKSPVKLTEHDTYKIKDGHYQNQKVQIIKSCKDLYGINSLNDLKKENSHLFTDTWLITYICQCLKDYSDETRIALTLAISHNNISAESYIKQEYVADEFYLVQCTDNPFTRFCVHASWLEKITPAPNPQD